MRIIVPLHGVVQGRGRLVIGSLVPCAIFYLLQIYLKRRRGQPSPPPPPPFRLPPSPSSLPSRGSPAMVSARASVVLRAADSLYYAGLSKCQDDPYDHESNPGGIIQLGLAENLLTLDLLRDWMATHLECCSLVDGKEGALSVHGVATYQQPLDGLMELKIAVAGFLKRVMPGTSSFDPQQMILTSGATPAIETLSFCLADPGNAILVPSPYYPGFDRDIKLRSGVELIPVSCRSADNFSPNIGALERAYNQAKKRGVKVRAVLVCNPSNPVGSLLDRQTIRDLLHFVAKRNIHLLSDEIYAGSTYGTTEFVSVTEVLEEDETYRSSVHLIYGLSKDLCLPGFRVGVIYSYNPEVLAAARKFSRFSAISAPTQRLLVLMLSDTRFITDYLKANKERLRKMYPLFVEGLQGLGIRCARSGGGFYCWADMSKFIRPYSEKGEIELWGKLLNVAKVNVTPGSSCHCIEPGWFRCCFTTLAEKDVPVVIERIRRVTGIGGANR